MQLLQAKVKCLKGIVDSGWFKPGRNVTLLWGQSREIISQILRGLEALNPIYDIVLVDPLGDYPRTWQQGEHQRYVIQEKKTAVYMIFAANPDLVKKLSLIDESLIETDRIEFGRRLDYSRWVSFVELSASARWSDIAEAMHSLRDQRIGNEDLTDSSDETFFSVCQQTDRIKGDLGTKCREWLLANEFHWSGDSADLYTRCLREVNLYERFKLANNFVEESLPPMVCLQPEDILTENYSFSEVVSAPSNAGPVTALLQQLCTKFDLTLLNQKDIERVRQRISDLSSIGPLARFPVTLAIDDRGIALEGVEKLRNSRLAKRILLLPFVALLTQLLWQRFPFFLLDRYDKDLSDRERFELADCLTEFGAYMQIIMSPDRAGIRRDYGFAKVLWMNDKGLIEEEPERPAL